MDDGSFLEEKVKTDSGATHHSLLATGSHMSKHSPTSHYRCNVMSMFYPPSFDCHSDFEVMGFAVWDDIQRGWFAEDMMTVRETGGFVEF
jgi:hypothetical protein